MMEIDCTCGSCQEKFVHQFREDVALCNKCTSKLISDFKKRFDYQEIEMNKIKKSFSISGFMKWGTYYMILFCPLPWYMYYRYGFTAEMWFLVGVTAYPYFHNISEWLCRKF